MDDKQWEDAKVVYFKAKALWDMQRRARLEWLSSRSNITPTTIQIKRWEPEPIFPGEGDRHPCPSLPLGATFRDNSLNKSKKKADTITKPIVNPVKPSPQQIESLIARIKSAVSKGS